MTSVGISAPGDLDSKKLDDWISTLLRVKGGDIYRMKGILAVKGANKRLVFQGVHMMLDGDHQRAWHEGEPRESRIVFIGRNLKKDLIRKGFEACRA